MPATQRAVWRNGGSNSAEIDVRTRTEVARRTLSVSRRYVKPPVVVCNRGGHVRCENDVRTRTKRTSTKKVFFQILFLV